MHLEFWYAAFGMGVVCHTLNPRLPGEQLAGMIRKAGDRVLAVGAGLEELAEKIVRARPTIEHIVMIDEPHAVSPRSNDFSAHVWRQSDLPRELGWSTMWGDFAETVPAGLCSRPGRPVRRKA